MAVDSRQAGTGAGGSSGGRDALFQEPLEGGRVRCVLCPHRCVIAEGRAGICGVRAVEGGRLKATTWGRPAAVNIDPIEKKPLYHFLPGTPILSLGTAGCNLTCRFCQNWDLARSRVGQRPFYDLPPDRVVALAREQGCPSVALTYNEPTVFAEYAMDVARLAREAGLRTVLVTNGYVTQEALPALYEHVDAANVDLKAFTDAFYRKQTGGDLRPVQETLVALVRRGVWVEITTLLIPGLNDDPDEVRAETAWIRDNLGTDVPVHFSAFHPDYHLRDRDATPPATLRAARDIAREAGLRYVYEGNVVSDGSNTRCPSCGNVVITRSWACGVRVRLDADDRCTCGQVIPIRH